MAGRATRCGILYGVGGPKLDAMAGGRNGAARRSSGPCRSPQFLSLHSLPHGALMNFGIEDVWADGVVTWFFGLAPLLYLALAWRSARRGSLRGVWGTAGAMLAVVALVVMVTGFVAVTHFRWGSTLVFTLLVLGSGFAACAAVLHFAIRARGSAGGAGSLVVAALLGYLAMPLALVLALMVLAFYIGATHGAG